MAEEFQVGGAIMAPPIQECNETWGLIISKTFILLKFAVLPYILDAHTLKKAKKQPKFVKSHDFQESKYEFESKGYAREDLMAKICRGEIREDDSYTTNYCHYLHNFDPYLKIGPFHLEVYTKSPTRVVFHDFLSEKEINHIIKISLPNLSHKRYVSSSNKAGDAYEYESGQRIIDVYKTNQHWFSGKFKQSKQYTIPISFLI